MFGYKGSVASSSARTGVLRTRRICCRKSNKKRHYFFSGAEHITRNRSVEREKKKYLIKFTFQLVIVSQVIGAVFISQYAFDFQSPQYMYCTGGVQ